MFSFFITWFDVYISNAKALRVFWWLQHALFVLCDSDNRKLTSLPRGPWQRPPRTSGGCCGSTIPPSLWCSPSCVRWAEWVSPYKTLRPQEEWGFHFKNPSASVISLKHRVLWTCSGPFITVLNFNLQSHIKFFHLCVLKKELVLLFQWNTIIETNTSDLFWLSMCSYFLSLWTS